METEQRTALGILWRGALLVAAVMLLAQLIVWVMSGQLKTVQWNRLTGGVRSVQEASTEARRPRCEAQALVFGSSVSVGLSPAPVTQNYSFYGAGPDLVAEMIRRVMRERKNCPRAQVVFVEVLPSLFTTASVKTYARSGRRKLAHLRDWSELATGESLPGTWQLAQDKMRGELGHETLGLWLFETLIPYRQRPENRIGNYERTSDLRNLRLSSEAIAHLVARADDLHKLGARVIYYVPPENHWAWRYSPEGSQNRARLLAHFPGEELRDLVTFQNLAAHDFRDAVHLQASGQQEFNRQLQHLYRELAP